MGRDHPGLFADLGKRVNDLLTKEFPSEKQENKFAWKGQANNEVTLETTFLQKKRWLYIGNIYPKV